MSFIVLEGLDGAGKSTQIKQLQNILEQKGIEYEYVHFPRFDAPIYGELIARFLRGELGSVDQVDPYLVALIYAGDRAQATPMIREWIRQGKFVIIDRYTYSNIAYQCAKIADAGKQHDLSEWIKNLEYGFNNIPRPDLTLFLDVPFKFTENKLTNQREGEDRSYLKGSKDIHEASLDLQQRVRQVYLTEARNNDDITVVDCSDAEGNMLKPELIFEKIYARIEHLF